MELSRRTLRLPHRTEPDQREAASERGGGRGSYRSRYPELAQGAEDPVTDDDDDEEDVKPPTTPSGGERASALSTIGGMVWKGAELPSSGAEEEEALPAAPTGARREN